MYIPVSAGYDMETPARAALVVLGQVCKYWREVVWGDRSLWSRLRINLGSVVTEVLSINATTPFRPPTSQWLSWTKKIFEAISHCRELWISCGGRHLSWFEDLNPVFNRLESLFRMEFDYSSACLELSTALHLPSARLEVAPPEKLFLFAFSTGPHLYLIELCRE